MFIEGYASTPTLDHARDVVLPTAFETSIRKYGIGGPKGIKLLAQHDTRLPVGRIHTLEVRPQGLWMEGEIDEGISYGKDLAQAIRANGGLSYSIGYRLSKSGVQFVDQGDDSYFKIHELDLHEVSIVTIPCNADCVMEYTDSAEEKALRAVKRLKNTFQPTRPTLSDQINELRTAIGALKHGR